MVIFPKLTSADSTHRLPGGLGGLAELDDGLHLHVADLRLREDELAPLLGGLL